MFEWPTAPRIVADPYGVDLILGVVATRWGFKVADLQGRARNPQIVRARSVAAYVLRHLNQFSFEEIGEVLGGVQGDTVRRGWLAEGIERDAKLVAREVVDIAGMSAAA